MEWKEVTLGEITNLVIDYRGKTPLKLGSSWSDSGYRALSAKNIKTGQIVAEDSIRFVDEELYRKWMKDEVKKGDILITSEAPFGQIYYWDSDEKIVLSQRLFDVRLNDEVCHKYVYYFMTSHRYQKDLEGRATGTTVTGLRQPELLKSTILLPPLSAQRSIASILSSLDRKIELNSKINADLEEMAQAIFKNWFVDFEPFKDGKFVNSELGMIPEGWKVGSPYEYVKVVYGAPYKSAKFNDNGEGLPLIRIRDLKDCKPQFYTPEILPQTEYVNMGDIVAGMDAEFVPHIWKGKTGLLNQRVCKLIPQQTSISNLFVLYLMKPELEFVQSYKTGTTVSHLGKADIDKFVVVLPPLEVVEDCSKLLDSILQRIKNISAESRNLSLLRDTLLPRLMSGEIEVPE